MSREESIFTRLALMDQFHVNYFKTNSNFLKKLKFSQKFFGENMNSQQFLNNI